MAELVSLGGLAVLWLGDTCTDRRKAGVAVLVQGNLDDVLVVEDNSMLMKQVIAKPWPWVNVDTTTQKAGYGLFDNWLGRHLKK